MGKPIDVAPYYFISLVFMASMPSLSQAISCTGSAKYRLTFKAEWTAKSHPEDFPSANGPHFSSVVGCTHNASYVMWRPGVNATLGVQKVAETGNPDEMNKELDQQITLKTALGKFLGGGISNTGTRTVNDIQVNTQYPLVSAISMIAPSPDWFVGVRDYSLCNETTGKWIDKRVKSLALYDSGTDSAPRFVHGSGIPTEPHVPIFLLDNTHEGSLKSNETTKPFGTFTFEKTFDSNPLPTPTATSPVASMAPTGKSSMVPTVETVESSKVPAGMASTKSGMTQVNMTSSVTHSRGPTQSSTKSGACSFVYQSISVSLKLIISSMLTMYII